jgi:hypothetical protein
MTFVEHYTCKLLYIHDPSARFDVLCTQCRYAHQSASIIVRKQKNPMHTSLGPTTRDNIPLNSTSSVLFLLGTHAKAAKKSITIIVDMHICKIKKKPITQGTCLADARTPFFLVSDLDLKALTA